MRRFGLKMKRHPIPLSHGLKGQGTIDLEAAAASDRHLMRLSLDRTSIDATRVNDLFPGY
jgi:hypothetical protein